MDDDIEKQYELYRSGNIDELMSMLDGEETNSSAIANSKSTIATQGISGPQGGGRTETRGSGGPRGGQGGPRGGPGGPRGGPGGPRGPRGAQEVPRGGPGGSIVPYQSAGAIRSRPPPVKSRPSQSLPDNRRRKNTKADNPGGEGSSAGSTVIDPDWMMQDTPGGISVADFAGPLNLPDQDFFNLNTRRHATAKGASNSGNQGSSFRSSRYTARTSAEPKSQQSPKPQTGNKTSLRKPQQSQQSQQSQSRQDFPSGLLAQEEERSEKEKRINVGDMLSSGMDVLGKVRAMLASNQTIPPDGLAGLEAVEKMQQDQAGRLPPPPVPAEKIEELHSVQDHWIELDNEIKGIRSLIRELQKKKKELEDYLKSEMQKYQIPHLTPANGSEKIVLKTGNRKGTYKKDYIFAKLQEKLGDPEMAANLAEHLEKSRPVNETVTIARSKR